MREPRRVVLVSAPFQGHISPMLELGTALHSKGFSIIIAHIKLNSPNSANHPKLTFCSISDGLEDQDVSNWDLVTLMKTFNKNFQAPFEELLTELMQQEGVLCVIHDAIMYSVDRVAERVKLPRIIFHTCSAAAIAACGSLPHLGEEGYFPLQESKLQDLLPGLEPLRLKDLPFVKCQTLESQIELIGFICNIERSSSIIWNSIECLENHPLEELQKQYKIPFFSLGPLFKMIPASSTSLLAADTSCISWLDKQAPKSVIYVSLGSLMRIGEDELAEMAWGLANCGQPFLWVIRPGSVNGSQWIELLPKGYQDSISEKGLIIKWAPQREVLAHEAIGGFWSHCGWNSTLESISEGVPMISFPGFGDQNVNARYISHVWKVGLEFDGNIERGKIEEVIKRLMVDEEGKEVQKRVNDLKGKVELGILEGGSSYNSLNDLAKYILSL